jgi:hypothetical protein
MLEKMDRGEHSNIQAFWVVVLKRGELEGSSSVRSWFVVA